MFTPSSANCRNHNQLLVLRYMNTYQLCTNVHDETKQRYVEKKNQTGKLYFKIGDMSEGP